MSWFNKPGRLVSRSLKYDFDFLRLPSLRFQTKIEFIVKKYLSLIVYRTQTSLLGEKYYFTDWAGIAFLQAVFVDNAFLENYCPTPKVIIDIGAHTGQFNFFSKRHLKANRVYSFEPIKQSFKTLSLNTRGENIFPWAISTSPVVDLLTPNNKSYMASIFKLAPASTVEKVEARKLDEVKEINQLSQVDLLKIDTEGSELEVLKTCRQTLKKTRYVLVECSLDRPNSGDLTDVCCFLDKNNFRAVHLGRPYLTQNNTIGAVDILFISS